MSVKLKQTFLTDRDQKPGAISVTDAATNKVLLLLQSESTPDLSLRVSVRGGGCSGFTYQFAFESGYQADEAGCRPEGLRGCAPGSRGHP